MREGALSNELTQLRPVMVRWVLARAGSPDLAEEVVQQALLRALERLHTLKQPQRLRAWLRTIVQHTLVDELRRQQRLVPLDGTGPEPTVAEHEDPGCTCILGLLPRIRPAYAALVEAVDLQEQPLKHAAHALGISANNAGVRLHRARQALKRELLETCGTDSVSRPARIAVAQAVHNRTGGC